MTLLLNTGSGSREGGSGTSAWYEIHVQAKMVAIQLRIVPNRVRQWWISLQVGDEMSTKNEVLCRVCGIIGEACIRPINVTNRSVYFLRLG